jgi:hypothetical protein
MNLVQIICQLGILFVVVAAIVVAAIPIVALLFLYDGVVMDELKRTSGLGNGNAPLAMMIHDGEKQGQVSEVLAPFGYGIAWRGSHVVSTCRKYSTCSNTYIGAVFFQ